MYNPKVDPSCHFLWPLSSSASSSSLPPSLGLLRLKPSTLSILSLGFPSVFTVSEIVVSSSSNSDNREIDEYHDTSSKSSNNSSSSDSNSGGNMKDEQYTSGVLGVPLKVL